MNAKVRAAEGNPLYAELWLYRAEDSDHVPVKNISIKVSPTLTESLVRGEVTAESPQVFGTDDEPGYLAQRLTSLMPTRLLHPNTKNLFKLADKFGQPFQTKKDERTVLEQKLARAFSSSSDRLTPR
jgi:hypothetical protein